MRIVAWNCNRGFHGKLGRLLDLKPDIAVISECARPEVLMEKSGFRAFSAPPVWTGRDKHRGLAIFFFGGAKGSIHNVIASDLPGILPVEVTAPRRFNLLAVWAPTGLRKADPGPVRRSLDVYRDFLTGEKAVLAGDFNHNVRWDKPGWASNFRETADILEGWGLVSAYHATTGEEFGKESAYTYYHAALNRAPYHIDYIFAPCARTKGSFKLGVGSREDWIDARLSDHVPLVLDIADA